MIWGMVCVCTDRTINGSKKKKEFKTKRKKRAICCAYNVKVTVKCGEVPTLRACLV